MGPARSFIPIATYVAYPPILVLKNSEDVSHIPYVERRMALEYGQYSTLWYRFVCVII